ncbi:MULTISPECIES: tetratricopeptide repeat protein [unclassified Sporolactobacillus]|uniref:tetratricopeptide repeat protein n=1 Tax=unclassified Sporolactobacillus TaxID=2628533 RepID=UPI00236775B7|nr:tetratricopeptide repeat protein [Sporolactobacillus sp. CQH2019]MDD9148092.1 tetratricopeptide repeat protein [Sporolactobacillus sp. CQH2019]
MKEKSRQKKAHVISFHHDGEFFYQRGMVCYQKGDLERASKYLNRALMFKPDEVEYLCQQAAILSEMEEYETSISLLKKVVYELDDKLTDCYFFLANNYAYLGDFQEALDEVSTYLAMEPDGVFRHEALELYRMLSEEVEDTDTGAAAYISIHEKGRLALERGHFEEAIVFFKKVIEDEPNFLAAQNNLAIAYFSIGATVKALKTAEWVLERDPGNIHALCNLATFFYQLDDSDDLAVIMQRLDRLYPLLPEHCGKLGSTYLYVGDYEKACRWLKIAERKGARCDQVFYFWMALAAYHTGDQKLAERSWRQVDYFSGKPFHPFKYSKIQSMIFEPDAQKNFMVHDLIRKEVWEGNRAYQLFSLFYLAGIGDETTLEEVAGRGTDFVVKGIARRLLEERRAEKTDMRLQIMRQVEARVGGEKEALKNPELYSFWSVVDSVIGPSGDMDCSGWSAALLYLWKKEFGGRTSQKEIARELGTTVYRLRKHVGELAAALDKQWEDGMTWL